MLSLHQKNHVRPTQMLRSDGLHGRRVQPRRHHLEPLPLREDLLRRRTPPLIAATDEQHPHYFTISTSSPMRSPPLPNHTFRPSPKEAPMRIAINLLDQHGELPMRCQRLIRLPSERRPLPKQPPLSRLAIELEFRDPVI